MSEEAAVPPAPVRSLDVLEASADELSAMLIARNGSTTAANRKGEVS
jgi:hypothetical protein